jgi:hypothetical protein
MVAGYGGIYRATVLNDVDPMGQRRLQVQVPEVFGDGPVWAAASLPVGAQDPLPAVGEAVWASFEHGDTDYPVWERAMAGQGRAMANRGYLGKYHGLVTDTDDPLYQRRLLVSVPELDPTPVWAVPGEDVPDGAELPALGSGVWVEYEDGDAGLPRWVGLA